MRDARYLRIQAELCLEVAEKVSDRNSAEKLRVQAADYLAGAVALELQLAGMPRFYFPVDYDGTTYGDDRGEIFPTFQEAEDYATKVADELGRNGPKSVTVRVVTADGTVLGHASYLGCEQSSFEAAGGLRCAGSGAANDEAPG